MIQKGIHVLVEKPLTETSEQSKHLVDEAAKKQVVLMVDHTFIYTGAVRKIKELVDKVSDLSAEQILDYIIKHVKAYMGKAHQHDDMTMVVVKVN